MPNPKPRPVRKRVKQVAVRWYWRAFWWTTGKVFSWRGLRVIAVLFLISALSGGVQNLWGRWKSEEARANSGWLVAKTMGARPKKTITVETIKVVEKEVLKEVFVDQLPDWLLNDDDQQVLVSSTIPPHKGKTDVVATIDLQTGESGLTFRQRPYRRPWIGFPNDVSLLVGLGTGLQGRNLLVEGRWDAFRISSFTLTAYGMGLLGTEQSNVAGGVGVTWKW